MSSSQIMPSTSDITQNVLDSLNVPQEKGQNKVNLQQLGGVDALAAKIGTNLQTGLSPESVLQLRERFGKNVFPESPMEGYLSLLIGAFGDPVLIILLAASSVSVGVGSYEDPGHGWIEGVAIFIAVFAVANITAFNDYTKELQFRALENSSAKDERTSVLRNGVIERINPAELVVGDVIILQAGDMIHADSIVTDKDIVILTNESSLTGEPDDLKKSREGDPFVLSSCLVTQGEETRCLVIGIGEKSQWGKIKANLVSESVNTPLQDKLEEMTTLIGYVGMVFAFMTFAALVIQIWADWPKENGPIPRSHIIKGFIDAFILAVTIVVVAIPEGLPLAVTISLAYSTKKMYADQCFIRVLAACETMGNATNICSDKTGTLTENRMTVVEGWFGDRKIDQTQFETLALSEGVKKIIGDQCCVNRSAYLVYKSPEGKVFDKPLIIGNKTEGALMAMAKGWGFEYEAVHASVFKEGKDKTFSFNSQKKRSTAVIHMPDGVVRIYCKGASEWILKDCTAFLCEDGSNKPMSAEKRKDIENHINSMAELALRTLCLAHKDFPNAAALPANWEENPPDNSELILDCIVGIIDPLRSDVKEAVKTAQGAGVTVRMVTGDNIATACAIARQCGILTEKGTAIEGPVLRNMSPKELDAILPNLQVMGRSSPDDKYLLVTRLNGYAVPDGKEAWEAKHKDKEGVAWETHKDKLLPGYREEWESTRPEGGDVVGVTGDGTNDAPALKAADVGLAMGITGTKVAQGASDIVILDDKFSSIVKAILWGRSVYDNIRKFLQFQLTVNVVALILVFIGAVVGFGQPLNAVQMLWVNLVMDTLGALALGTEEPTRDLLERRPYKRQASLISRPMMRHIAVQSTYQLALLFTLMFVGADWFNIHKGIACFDYKVLSSSTMWNPLTSEVTDDVTLGTITCSSFSAYCNHKDTDCLVESHQDQYGTIFRFNKLEEYEVKCLSCLHNDYTHGTILFNAFIFSQIFNEYVCRRLFDETNFFDGIFTNYMFLGVSAFSIGSQIFLVEVGGEYVKTSHLNITQWFVTIALGFVVVPLGMLERFIPVKEDPNSFFDSFHGAPAPADTKGTSETTYIPASIELTNA